MKRPAVIFDRDGTLASVAWIAPGPGAGDKAWADFNAAIRFDAPVPSVVALWHAIDPGIARIVVSGRDGSTFWAMTDWFRKHGIKPERFYQRRAGDRRVDSVVKEEILDTLILPHYDVRLVVDDRPQVCDMWRRRGLAVLQVTDPGIDPAILRS